MNDPSPLSYLEDIRREAAMAIAFLGERTLDQLRGDDRTAYAIIRALEIVGEAARNINVTTRARFPDAPWQYMTGMRDKLIHGYRVVDLEVVWETVTVDLPTLLPQVDEMIRELSKSEP